MNRKKDIVFVHGWGEDSRIWRAIAKFLPGYNHHYKELGFIQNNLPESEHIYNLDNAVFISHSLGTLWTLKHIAIDKICALIAINGFGRFTDFTDNKTLDIMAQTLRRNKVLQMKSFWKNCNLPKNMQQMYEPVLNESVLSQGLLWLSSWDQRNKLQKLRDRGIPVLSLGGKKDQILPPEIMQEHWEYIRINLVMHQQAGHALPITHPQWCAERIKETLE